MAKAQRKSVGDVWKIEGVWYVQFPKFVASYTRKYLATETSKMLRLYYF